MTRIGLLLAMLVLVSSPAISQTPDETLIVPGLRIGKWMLEMTVDDLVRMNGEGGPDSLSHPAYVGTFTVVSWTSQRLAALTRDRRKIEALSVDAGAFRTEKGTGIGSTRSSVIAAYGNPTAAIAIRPTIVAPVYDDLGTGFSIENDRVSVIWVFRSRTGASIWRLQAPAPTPSPTPTQGPGGNGY